MKLQDKIAYLDKIASEAIRYEKPWTAAESLDFVEKFSFHSNKLEGLKMSYGDTVEFFRTGTVHNNVQISDVVNLINHKAVLGEIVRTYNQRTLTMDSILKLHGELMKDERQWETNDPLIVRPGAFKDNINHGVRGSGKFKEYCYPVDVRRLLEVAISNFHHELRSADKHPIEAISKFHYEFLNEIHPFSDGNGRVARLLMASQLMQNGLPVFIIEDLEKSNYVGAIIASETSPEREPLTEFFVGKTIAEVQRRVKEHGLLPYLDKDTRVDQGVGY